MNATLLFEYRTTNDDFDNYSFLLLLLCSFFSDLPHFTMERPPGQTSDQYECMQCGSSFSKSSLLEQHKRILGHRYIFSCDICQKTFSRKDNLEAHQKKHDNTDYHHCDVCNQVFCRPDTLDLHKRNRHGKIGRGLTRKSDNSEGPPAKRRIAKYDDPEDSFKISFVGE